MKKFMIIAVALLACVSFNSCSNDDDNGMDVSPYAEAIIGTWNITHIQTSSGWIDITSWLFKDYQASATFNANGTYSGSGYFGNGTGTYKLSGDTVITYVDGEEYARYTIVSLVDGVAEMVMSMDGSSINIRCAKE